jgi:hypothetical protein
MTFARIVTYPIAFIGHVIATIGLMMMDRADFLHDKLLALDRERTA